MQVDCAEWFAGDMLGQIALAPDFFRFPYSPLIEYAGTVDIDIDGLGAYALY